MSEAVIITGLLLCWLVAAPATRASGSGPDPPPVGAGARALTPAPDPAPGAAIIRRVRAIVPVGIPVAPSPRPAAGEPTQRASSGERVVARPAVFTAAIHTARPRAEAAHRASRPDVAASSADEAPIVRATVTALAAAVGPISRLTGTVIWSSSRAHDGLALLGGALLLMLLSAASMATLRIVVREARG